MDMKPATFTLEVKGLELPDNVREEISLALNKTLMRKLGEVNLTGKNGGTAADWQWQQPFWESNPYRRRRLVAPD